MLPLQVIDSFLLNYNVGQALLLFFILATVGALPLKSRRIMAINVTVFGLVFIMTPQSLAPIHYLFLGIVLLVVGPVLWVTAER
ncbi:hypothetical protein EI982_15990 [Haloplanus rallus]|jgi:hypothetical protein|uniref:DUF8006 domain-containing protein n=1 Tax=Haloplanus rallus TaxID=1816183 RepID=A0A6B9FFS9_9EURY|nr:MULTISPECIES: hypothetical protein [Haloplanus]QGX96170.1 hypothetical protein EI982_15990 [Haloplanus rallus]